MRKSAWTAICFSLGVVVGFIIGRWAPIEPCEGSNDLRPNNPDEDGGPARYVGRPVHSREEFDSRERRLTRWLVVRKGDGVIVRHLIADNDTWNCILSNSGAVYQLPEAYMDLMMPVEPGVLARCS